MGLINGLFLLRKYRKKYENCVRGDFVCMRIGALHLYGSAFSFVLDVFIPLACNFTSVFVFAFVFLRFYANVSRKLIKIVSFNT